MVGTFSAKSGHETYSECEMKRINAHATSVQGHLIQTRFLGFFIPILPDLILPNQIQSTNRKKFFSLLIDEC